MISTNIWEYKDQTSSAPLLLRVHETKLCPCCKTAAKLVLADEKSQSDGYRYSEYINILCCETCGWWFAEKDVYDSSCGSNPNRALRVLSASGAALHTFSQGPDDCELTALEAEITEHIVGKGTSTSWDTLEDVTTNIFKDFGYTARVTARSKDGGIDVIVDHSSYGDVYAQVKHSKNKIGVRVLRELIGTMVLNDASNALLVTSSRFTKDATKVQLQAMQRGFVIELVDGSSLLSALNLTHRRAPPSVSDVLKIAKPNVSLILDEIEL